MKKYRLFFIILIISLILTGCWDYNDINKRNITLSVGVDNAHNGKGVEFSGENARLGPSKGHDGGQIGSASISSSFTFVSNGKDFEEARANYNKNIPLNDFSGATRAVVFSKEYAKNPGIDSYINRVINLFGYRSALLIAVSDIPTNELFNAKIKNDISIGHAVEDTLRHLSEEGDLVYKTIYEANSDILLEDVGYLIPYIGIRDSSISVLGYAVMSNDSRLIDIIKLNEMSTANLLLSKNAVQRKSYKCPAHPMQDISVKTSLKRRKIKTSIVNDSININIDLNLKSEIQYPYHYLSHNKNDIEPLEKSIEDKIQEDVLNIIKKSQEEFKIDCFDFARYFRVQNPEVYKKISWKEEYPNIKFTVKVKTKLVNTNLLEIYQE